DLLSLAPERRGSTLSSRSPTLVRSTLRRRATAFKTSKSTGLVMNSQAPSHQSCGSRSTGGLRVLGIQVNLPEKTSCWYHSFPEIELRSVSQLTSGFG